MAERRPRPIRQSRGRRRPRDELGLKRAIGDRLLPVLVAAMAFLAALGLAGFVAAGALARHWQQGAAAALTVQVPQPGQRLPNGKTRREAAAMLLTGTPGVLAARALSDEELSDLLRPWLGATAETLALPLPAVLEVRLADPAPDLDALAARLREAVPGTLIESHGAWVTRVALLARSLEACAGAALLVVGAVAVAVVTIATRSGLTARRAAIEIVHGLGATDGYVAAKFARRATVLAAIGGAVGALAALPVLLALATLAAPFAAAPGPPEGLAALPAELWLALPGLPAIAAAIGWLTAQATVRGWLRRLP